MSMKPWNYTNNCPVDLTVEITPPVMKTRRKKARRAQWSSFHRMNKTRPHRTVNGRGCVSRLLK